jgi:hypothetical protein
MIERSSRWYCIGEGERQFTGMGGAIAACRKEFELKKNPQKTPIIRVTENNSHGETSVQTIFRHQAGSKNQGTHSLLGVAGRTTAGSELHQMRENACYRQSQDKKPWTSDT